MIPLSEEENRIEVTGDDLKLVDAANFDDPPSLFEFRLDSKRPFGNSDIFQDMCEILDLELVELLNGSERVPARHREKLEHHAQKLGVVLEIVLKHGRETGIYIEEDGEWKRIGNLIKNSQDDCD